MDSKAGVLSDVCAALAVGDSSKAKTTLQEGYPFVPVEKIARRYSERESMKLFVRDGFIDSRSEYRRAIFSTGTNGYPS